MSVTAFYHRSQPTRKQTIFELASTSFSSSIDIDWTASRVGYSHPNGVSTIRISSNLNGSISFYYGKSEPMVISEVKQEAFGKCQIGENSEIDGLKSNVNKKGLIIGCIAAISYAFTADDLIDSYSSQIIFNSNINSDFGQSELLTIFLGILLFLSSVFGSLLIDRFSRRRLLIFGLLGTCLSNSIATVGFIYGSMVLQICGFALTKTFIGFGAGAPAWFLTSELVSPRVTSLCQSISTGALLIATGFVTLVYLSVNEWIGVCSIFLMASIPAFILAIFLILFLPETKDRNYEEIRADLMGSLFSGLKKSSKIYDRESNGLLTRKNGRAESQSYGSWASSHNLNNNDKISQMLHRRFDIVK
uniref:Major facilitator superfamily (MFS) profile domain-containing protein n=1 Tax=Acrobeloides nanus TaxID=290746 RepID=A0A914E7L6_9BILA